MNETIAAIATPFGVGGIGVVRISGENAKVVASKVFKPVGKRHIDNVSGFSAIYGRVFDKDGEFDEAVVTVYNAPKSYTGEDVVEISCHGGTYIMQRVLEACFFVGAVPADAGEFTKRAFLNGKLSLDKAEAVIDLINAKSKLSAAAAFNAKDGALSKKIDDIIAEVTEISAKLSVWTDYPDDEDIEQYTNDELFAKLSKVKDELINLLNSYEKGKIIHQGITACIVGKPNVGKSTLMNALSGVQTSIVTSVAGTTRDVVEETVKVGDIVLRLADTAGIHNTDDLVESIGVEAALKKIDGSALIIAVFDGTTPIDNNDKKIISLIEDRITLAVINKSDLQQSIDKDYISKKFRYIANISAKNSDGMEILSDKIKEIYKINSLDASSAVLYTARQKNSVQKALTATDEAIDAISMSMTLDACNVCIEDILSSLLELSGKTASEEIVNGIFTKFCVGK